MIFQHLRTETVDVSLEQKAFPSYKHQHLAKGWDKKFIAKTVLPHEVCAQDCIRKQSTMLMQWCTHIS